MEDHLGMNQSRLLCAEFLGGEAIFFQVAGAPIREEHVGIFKEAIKLGAIFLGVIQYRGAHSNLHVPGKCLYFRIVRPPDVENVRTVIREVSSHARSSDHVPHSECANAFQGSLCSALKRYRLTLSDLLDGDERHFGEHFGVLGLFEKLLVGTHLGENKSGLLPGRLQLVRAPLQNRIIYGFVVVSGPQKSERARVQLRVNVESHHVTFIACFPKKRNLPEWVISIKVHGRATTIDRFPFPLKKAGETPESLPDVDMNVLSFPSLGFPECCKGYAPGSQTYRRYRAKSMRAANEI